MAGVVLMSCFLPPPRSTVRFDAMAQLVASARTSVCVWVELGVVDVSERV